jgi:hypothetical protein
MRQCEVLRAPAGGGKFVHFCARVDLEFGDAGAKSRLYQGQLLNGVKPH